MALPSASSTAASIASRAAALAQAFGKRYGGEARVYRAPGRINLIGEHTDYNQGWVMPAAIDLAAFIAIAPRTDRVACIYSEQFQQQAEFDLDAAEAGPEADVPVWCRSLRGVALLLDRRARGGPRQSTLRGANVLIDSDVPVGAGLSSSAAVEVGLGWALEVECGPSQPTEIDRTALALLCQQASHEFAGVRCGIMDLYIAAHGRADHLVELDTRALSGTWHPWSSDLVLFVADTGVRHDHAAGEYNRRRAECEAAVAILARDHVQAQSLRDVTLADIDACASQLGPVLTARARHVVSENARVAAAGRALDAGDFENLGALLDASHASLRDDYAVSCAELDVLADLCRSHPGVYGARMMGGGFGGCVLALAAPGAVDDLSQTLAREYTRATGHPFRSWACSPAAGAGPVSLD